MACDDFTEYFYFIYTIQTTPATICIWEAGSNANGPKHISAVISQVSRRQLCDLTNVLWLDQCCMYRHPAWTAFTWGTGPGWRWETGNMELKVINNSKCPHLWFPSSFQTLMYATLNPSVLSQPPNC